MVEKNVLVASRGNPIQCLCPHSLHQGLSTTSHLSLSFKEKLIEVIGNETAEVEQKEAVGSNVRKLGHPPDTPAPIRMNNSKHLVVADHQQRECKVCSFRRMVEEKYTSYICANCPDKPHLCPKECFWKYHQQAKYKN